VTTDSTEAAKITPGYTGLRDRQLPVPIIEGREMGRKAKHPGEADMDEYFLLKNEPVRRS
jgi:hypothetical protein